MSIGCHVLSRFVSRLTTMFVVLMVGACSNPVVVGHDAPLLGERDGAKASGIAPDMLVGAWRSPGPFGEKEIDLRIERVESGFHVHIDDDGGDDVETTTYFVSTARIDGVEVFELMLTRADQDSMLERYGPFAVPTRQYGVIEQIDDQEIAARWLVLDKASPDAPYRIESTNQYLPIVLSDWAGVRTYLRDAMAAPEDNVMRIVLRRIDDPGAVDP